MKEPKRIPLTNSPRSKEIKKIRLDSIYNTDMTDDIPSPSNYKTFWKTFTVNNNENNPENNSESIPELESDSTD